LEAHNIQGTCQTSILLYASSQGFLKELRHHVSKDAILKRWSPFYS
jgi:hypothetical protein